MCSGVRLIGINDHSIVFGYRKLSIHGFPTGHCTITYRNFRKFNLESFCNEIASHDWDHIIHNLSKPNVVRMERQRLCTLTVSPRLSSNGSPIEHVTTAKSLGVLIDDKITWRIHIDKLTKKIASDIGAIKRVKHLVPHGTLYSIYQALVQLQFNYCNIA